MSRRTAGGPQRGKQGLGNPGAPEREAAEVQGQPAGQQLRAGGTSGQWQGEPRAVAGQGPAGGGRGRGDAPHHHRLPHLRLRLPVPQRPHPRTARLPRRERSRQAHRHQRDRPQPRRHKQGVREAAPQGGGAGDQIRRAAGSPPAQAAHPLQHLRVAQQHRRQEVHHHPPPHPQHHLLRQTREAHPQQDEPTHHLPPQDQTRRGRQDHLHTHTVPHRQLAQEECAHPLKIAECPPNEGAKQDPGGTVRVLPARHHPLPQDHEADHQSGHPRDQKAGDGLAGAGERDAGGGVHALQRVLGGVQDHGQVSLHQPGAARRAAAGVHPAATDQPGEPQQHRDHAEGAHARLQHGPPEEERLRGRRLLQLPPLRPRGRTPPPPGRELRHRRQGREHRAVRTRHHQPVLPRRHHELLQALLRAGGGHARPRQGNLPLLHLPRMTTTLSAFTHTAAHVIPPIHPTHPTHTSILPILPHPTHSYNMSKHSKNCTSSSVFTYRERQKLKGIYGTNDSRIGQDSIKKFEMCTICNNRLVEPTACDQGHIFCRPCVVEFLVKQKKRIAEQHAEVERANQRKELAVREKEVEKEVSRLEAFERYDTLTQVTRRGELARGEQPQPAETGVTLKEVKPIGIYELNARKSEFVKAAFWSLENAPAHVDAVEAQESKAVMCPGSNHKLTLKKLRPIQLREVEGEFLCWICSKEIRRQRIGTYKCGHTVCETCKSTRCEVCEESNGWAPLESSSSAFAAHAKAEVKTYTHAFVG